MAKYYVEQYHHYYPKGGMEDLSGPFDTLAEAQGAVNYGLFSDVTAIIRVEDNALTHAAWWDGAKWDYAEGVDSPHVNSIS